MKFAVRGHPCINVMCGSFALPLVREMKVASSERHKLSVETVCPDCGRRCFVPMHELTRRDVGCGLAGKTIPNPQFAASDLLKRKPRTNFKAGPRVRRSPNSLKVTS